MAEDDSLVLPPIMPGKDESKIPRRFDAVSGDHFLGYKNYMLYCNERVYPEYLITYVDENYVLYLLPFLYCMYFECRFRGKELTTIPP